MDTNKLHNLASNYIVNNINIDNTIFFENSHVNSTFIKLIKESKNTYNLLNTNNYSNIISSLDKKRSLTIEFKKLTGIDWSL